MSAPSGELTEEQQADSESQLEVESSLSETKDVLPVAAALEASTARQPQ